MKRVTGWTSSRHPRPFLGLAQPIFHFFSSYRGALTAHDLQIVELTLRIHCKLRHKTPRTLATSWRTLIKYFVIQHGKTAADHFRAFLVATRTRLLTGAESGTFQTAGYSDGISIAPALDTAAAVIALALRPARESVSGLTLLKRITAVPTTATNAVTSTGDFL
jgi:hypothetical protein